MKCVGALAVFLLCGCAPSAPEPPPPPDITSIRYTPSAEEVMVELRESGRRRVRPLDAYCNGAQCPNYAASAAEAAAEPQEPNGLLGCFRAVVGRCGDLRFTEIGDGFVGRTEYFNAAGELVAAHSLSDVGGYTYFGRQLSCFEIVTTDYCKATRAK
jgi:hypothetical protein